MIRYFVSYHFISSRQAGKGCINVSMVSPIKSYEDITEIRDMIIKGNKDDYGLPFKNVVILNWKRYEEDQYPNPPADQERRLYEACMKWRKEYQPSCEESIYQVDKVNEACPELVEELMNIIGWEDYSEESSK